MNYITSINKAQLVLVSNGKQVASFPASLNQSIISLDDAETLCGMSYSDVVVSDVKNDKGQWIAFEVVAYYDRFFGAWVHVVQKGIMTGDTFKQYGKTIVARRKDVSSSREEAISRGYHVAAKRIKGL
jgi:hypothetical protein